MADDGKLTAELAAIRQRTEAAADFPLAEIAEFLGPDTKSIGGWIAATALDVPPLLKAVEAALNLTADWHRNWAEGEAPHELARELREAIERELTGTGK